MGDIVRDGPGGLMGVRGSSMCVVAVWQQQTKFHDPSGVMLLPAMEAKGLTPILTVSDIASSFAWFEKWGWKKLWDWGTPPTFGAVGSGDEVCIFLCKGAQGGRGKGSNTTTFTSDIDDTLDKGVWMSLWVEDVDAVHKECGAAGLDITM